MQAYRTRPCRRTLEADWPEDPATKQGVVTFLVTICAGFPMRGGGGGIMAGEQRNVTRVVLLCPAASAESPQQRTITYKNPGGRSIRVALL